MGDVQRVDPAELTRRSVEMTGQNWHNPAAEAVLPPDALPSSAAAVANLNDNAQSLLGFQRWAEAENQRIAEMLQIAADAYTAVDETYGRVIENPERRAAVDAITVPAPSTPPAPLPAPVAAPQSLDAGGYSDVHKTQADLVAGDHGASLKTAMLQWSLAATRVRDNAARPPSGDWEGAAADAAYARMAEFDGWLEQLAEGWRELAESAAKVVEAHDTAKSEHAGIHSEYVALETQLRQLAAQMTADNSVATQNEMEKIQKRMHELQQRSDEVRRQYASDATFSPVRPAMPSRGDAESAATAAGGGGGGRPSGAPAGTAEQMAQFLGEPQTTSAGRPPGGEAAAGGGPAGGGAPAGGAPAGGSGAGAGTPSGLPGGALSTPKLPTDPSLRPAAASGGGGSGDGAGGGGGGMPAAPMSAPVSAETVAPAPAMPAAASAAAGPSADRTAGAMAGGMAPMGHGAGAQPGREKRRDPRLAPDEELYTEDRPWTEAVVGSRRRRDVGDGGGGGGGKDAP